MRIQGVLRLTTGVVLSVAAAVPSPAARAGVGTDGPERCRVEQGGYVASDHKTVYTFHQAYCLAPAKTKVGISSRTYRNGTLVTSRGARTCAAGSYSSGVCKGSDSMTWRNSPRDVICIQTRIDFVVEGRAQPADLDTSCVTWHSDSATYARLGPLDVGAGCDPASMHFPLNGQVQARHLGRCSSYVRSVSMNWVFSRNSSYNSMVQRTPYHNKSCAPSSAVAFSCTSTTALTNVSGSQLYCAATDVAWEYRSPSEASAPHDFGKSCWYF